MNWLNSRRLGGTLLTAGVLAGTAVAATPESGTVSAASPKIKWTSDLTASWVPSRAVIAEQAAGAEGTVPCEAPTCDTFTLTVADQKDLAIGLNGPQADDQLIYRITKPDGSYLSGTENAGANGYLVVKIKAAPVGDYKIELWDFYTDAASHANYAELAVAPPATAEPASAPAAGSPSPAPSSGPAPAPATVEAISVSVKAGKGSAKKRKLPMTVTVSRPVTKVTATLLKGKKAIARGTFGAMSGTKQLTLKLGKKVKPGSYSLAVSVTDGKSTAAKTVKAKVAKK